MALKYANNAKTTLNGAITNVATSITVTNGAVFPTLGGSDYFYMTLEDVTLQNEIVKVTARSGNTLTIVRAQNGTTAKAFANADKAEGRVVTGILDDLAALVNGVVPGSAFMALVDDTTNGALLTTLGISASVQTWLATPSSANLLAAMSDKTGTGLLVFGTSPTLTTPALGTPSALVLTNATGLPLASVTGLGSGIATWLATPSSANLRAAMTDESGSGALLFASGALGTPASGVLTNCTGLPNASVVGLGTAALVANSGLVHIAGTETITGRKLFSGSGNTIVFNRGASPEYTIEIQDNGTIRSYLGGNVTNLFSVKNSGGTDMLAVTATTASVYGDPVMTRGANETVTGVKTFSNSVTTTNALAITLARSSFDQWQIVHGTANTTAGMGILQATAGLYAMWISASTQYVGIGTVDPTYRFQVKAASGQSALFETTAGIGGIVIKTNNGGGNYAGWLDFVDGSNTVSLRTVATGTQFRVAFNNTEYFFFTTSALTAPDFVISSDERLKKDFTPFKDALDIVRQLRAGEYTRISTGKREYGFMAQDFERAGVPLFVDNTTSTKSLKYPRTPALLAAAIKELLLRVEALEAR